MLEGQTHELERETGLAKPPSWLFERNILIQIPPEKRKVNWISSVVSKRCSEQLSELAQKNINTSDRESLIRAGFVFVNFIGDGNRPIIGGTHLVDGEEVDFTKKAFLTKKELAAAKLQTSYQPQQSEHPKIELVAEDMFRFIYGIVEYTAKFEEICKDTEFVQPVNSLVSALADKIPLNTNYLSPVNVIKSLLELAHLDIYRGMKLPNITELMARRRTTLSNAFLECDFMVADFFDLSVNYNGKDWRINTLTALMAFYGIENTQGYGDEDQQYLRIKDYFENIYQVPDYTSEKLQNYQKVGLSKKLDEIGQQILVKENFLSRRRLQTEKGKIELYLYSIVSLVHELGTGNKPRFDTLCHLLDLVDNLSTKKYNDDRLIKLKTDVLRKIKREILLFVKNSPQKENLLGILYMRFEDVFSNDELEALNSSETERSS